MKTIIGALCLVCGWFSIAQAYYKVHEINFTPGTACYNMIHQQIMDAKESVNAVIYTFTDRGIAAALVKKHREGLDVDVIMDEKGSKSKGSVYQHLIDSKVPVTLSKGVKIEHNKYLVVDKTKVITGSYNWTHAAKLSNSENCIRFDDEDNVYYSRFHWLKFKYKGEE